MENLLPWMVLIRACDLGPVQQIKLLDVFEDPGQIVSAPEKTLKSLGLKSTTIKSIKNPDNKKVTEDVIWLDNPNHFLITWNDPRYPYRLKEITDPPVAVFLAGNPEILNSRQIGIVGSRNPSISGKRITHQFSGQLVKSGLTVTSGLALGIDYCAHLGALDAGGYTIAVLGSGPDIIYPPRHKDIAAQISTRGALLSEFPPGTPPLAGNFPRRNRIISGLTLGVVVVEAAKKSGSLITARCALEQGREVFSVPGSIYNPLSKGCHHLIKQGAKLVETIDDILEELYLNVPVNHGDTKNHAIHSISDIEFSIEYKQLLDNISFDPVSIDELIETTGLTSDTVSSMLLILEIQGYVSLSGGLYTRIR
jgi:DNA processing protein